MPKIQEAAQRDCYHTNIFRAQLISSMAKTVKEQATHNFCRLDIPDQDVGSSPVKLLSFKYLMQDESTTYKCALGNKTYKNFKLVRADQDVGSPPVNSFPHNNLGCI